MSTNWEPNSINKSQTVGFSCSWMSWRESIRVPPGIKERVQSYMPNINMIFKTLSTIVCRKNYSSKRNGWHVLKEVSYVYNAAFVWSKIQWKQYNFKIILQFKITIFCLNKYTNIVYSCDGKAQFSASLLQSSMSHDPLEIILICWFAA